MLTAFKKLKIISEDCNTSTSIAYWPPSTSWRLYQRIVILLLQSHIDHLQQVEADIIFTCWRWSVFDWSRSITILWYNLQLVEGGQYVIEVEVLQSSYIIFTCWTEDCNTSTSITYYRLQQVEDYIRGL
jgi:hypothetical protein